MVHRSTRVGWNLARSTVLVLIPLFSLPVCAQVTAFPGAEGFGRFATGGRGGKVIEVTNLNDSGPGSLREAVRDTGARSVVFRVSGTIALDSVLSIRNGNITIAGQTAPGDGICLRNYSLYLEGDNIIVRFIRCRMGDAAAFQDDALHAMEGNRVIVDHCSCSWSIDETASLYGRIRDLTVQWCIISESLNESKHEKGEHGYGGIWGGVNSTFHHNLLAHHTSRNPRFNNGHTHFADEHIDCVNNVVYNWGFNSAYGGELGEHNLRSNYYKAGPATKPDVRNRILEPWDTSGEWYVSGNYVDGFPGITADNWSGGVQGKYSAYQSVKKAAVPFASASVTVQTPQEAYASVLKFAGACVPRRDTVDARVIEETRTGTAKYGKRWGGGGTGIIDSQEDVGGWPALKSAPAPLDTDHDGMPDDWERSHGLNPGDPSDRNTLDGNGYTMLEMYLNGLVSHVMIH